MGPRTAVNEMERVVGAFCSRRGLRRPRVLLLSRRARTGTQPDNALPRPILPIVVSQGSARRPSGGCCELLADCGRDDVGFPGRLFREHVLLHGSGSSPDLHGDRLAAASLARRARQPESMAGDDGAWSPTVRHRARSCWPTRSTCWPALTHIGLIVVGMARHGFQVSLGDHGHKSSAPTARLRRRPWQ